MGGCLAQCIAGTHCNTATGLCESQHTTGPVPSPPKRKRKHKDGDAAVASSEELYEAGHEYEVPATAGDAGCEPTHVEAGDGGAIACEMDGGTI